MNQTDQQVNEETSALLILIREGSGLLAKSQHVQKPFLNT